MTGNFTLQITTIGDQFPGSLHITQEYGNVKRFWSEPSMFFMEDVNGKIIGLPIHKVVNIVAE